MLEKYFLFTPLPATEPKNPYEKGIKITIPILRGLHDNLLCEWMDHIGANPHDPYWSVQLAYHKGTLCRVAYKDKSPFAPMGCPEMPGFRLDGENKLLQRAVAIGIALAVMWEDYAHRAWETACGSISRELHSLAEKARQEQGGQ